MACPAKLQYVIQCCYSTVFPVVGWFFFLVFRVRGSLRRLGEYVGNEEDALDSFMIVGVDGERIRPVVWNNGRVQFRRSTVSIWIVDLAVEYIS